MFRHARGVGLDHLRAVARLDAAGEGYFGVLRGRGDPDHVYEETQILLGNAVLEAAADALRALQARAAGEEATKVARTLELVDSAYYSADRRLEMPEGSAEELRDLMIRGGFRNVRFELLTSGVAAFHFGEK